MKGYKMDRKTIVVDDFDIEVLHHAVHEFYHENKCLALVSLLAPIKKKVIHPMAWRFVGTSYIEYRMQFRRAIGKLDLTVTLNPESASGVLLFASRYQDGSGSFILIQMVNQTLEFGVSTGEELTLISLPHQLELGVWNTVTATFVYSPGYAYLIHDGFVTSISSVQTDQSKDGLILANGGSLYIGSIPSDVTQLPHGVIQQGFVGCIAPIEIEVVGRYTIEGAKMFKNVDQCY